MNPFDQILKLRTEEIHSVETAKSSNNIFDDVKIESHPQMVPNNFNSAHGDSYCSESVSLNGPIAPDGKLKVFKEFNPCGFTPCMVCNSDNQMIGVACDNDNQFRLLVFDSDCRIVSITKLGSRNKGSFGGGYFYLDDGENTIVVNDNKIESYPTKSIDSQKGIVSSLNARWSSDNIPSLISDSGKGNTLYSVLPVWGQPSYYWFILSGNYSYSDNSLYSSAFVGVVKIDVSESSTSTTIVDSIELNSQWNNNTFAVDEKAAYIVTNGYGNKDGALYRFSFDGDSRINQDWQYDYDQNNCGYFKPGQGNSGSGTTPTLFNDDNENKLVAITDNSDPQINVVVVNRETGKFITSQPVFPKMRSANEASLIGVENSLFVANNFGHVPAAARSQYAPNEPGMNKIEITITGSYSASDIVWENHYTHFYAMSMLCRGSGIIFAHTCDWSDDISITKGGMYYVSAIDSYTGRVIWRIPLGRGFEYCHEYGGVYFNHNDDLFIGTNGYLISIQNA